MLIGFAVFAVLLLAAGVTVALVLKKKGKLFSKFSVLLVFPLCWHPA